MTAAIIKVDLKRFKPIAPAEGRVMCSPGDLLHESTYKHVMREVAQENFDGAIAPGDLDDEFRLFIRTAAIGHTVSIENERLDPIKPTRDVPQPERTSRQLAVTGIRWLAPKLVAPLVTAAVAWLIKHVPDFVRHLF
jgi:hypothetical protein